MLVHGAWHGGWCWSRVAEPLRRAGHTVHAPTLTGVGERSHHYRDDIGLATHVDDVVNEALWNDLDDIVLVGHSYGGIVISGAVERLGDRVASMVFLDAFVPEDGQSARDISGFTHDCGPIPPYPADRFQVGERDRAWIDGKTTSQPPLTLTERLRLSGARERVSRKAYVLAALGVAPFLQATYARCAAAGWDTYTIDSGHELMIERPEKVLDILLRQAASPLGAEKRPRD